jgi:hypothetical protein
MNTGPSTSTFCSGAGRVMMPGFQFSPNNACVLFLFPGWSLDSPTKYAFGIIGAMALGLLNHPLVLLRNKTQTEALKTILYGIQMTLAYFMMLLVMLYEIGIFLGLITGLMGGFALTSYFGFLSTDSSTPCCADVDITCCESPKPLIVVSNK